MGLSVEDRAPTAIAVSDLLKTMKDTLVALGNTADVLGTQTARVASLGPAANALSEVYILVCNRCRIVTQMVSQIKGLQDELQRQQGVQEERMQGVREKLRDEVKRHFRETLRPLVDGIVVTCVKKVINERVRREVRCRELRCVDSPNFYTNLEMPSSLSRFPQLCGRNS